RGDFRNLTLPRFTLLFNDQYLLQLQRNEVIALLNLLHRLSESVKLVNEIVPSAELTSKPRLHGFFSLWQRAHEAVRTFRLTLPL
ncbi:hypothetical protein MIMGU_mgv1a0070611mg, partial [Erythranthe guttata]